MLLKRETDNALWHAFAAGDKEAYAHLYRSHHPRLFNYGHKFTRDTKLVEDAIQEVFIYCWIHRNRFFDVEAPANYLLTAFRNRLVKTLVDAMKSRRSAGIEDIHFHLEASIDQVMINRERIYEQHTSLTFALEKLTGRQKEAIFLLFYENRSYTDIAMILDISTKGAYKLIARALGELRTAYREKAVLYLQPLIIGLSILLSITN